jgi:DNA-binding winged helix-turn-helix (wHTH) protein
MSWPQFKRHEFSYRGVTYRATPKAVELLSVLLLRRGQFLSAAELTEALWPDPNSGPTFERDNIYQHICALNHCLPGMIVNTRSIGWMIPLPIELAEAA